MKPLRKILLTLSLTLAATCAASPLWPSFDFGPDSEPHWFLAHGAIGWTNGECVVREYFDFWLLVPLCLVYPAVCAVQHMLMKRHAGGGFPIEPPE